MAPVVLPETRAPLPAAKSSNRCSSNPASATLSAVVGTICQIRSRAGQARQATVPYLKSIARPGHRLFRIPILPLYAISRVAFQSLRQSQAPPIDLTARRAQDDHVRARTTLTAPVLAALRFAVPGPAPVALIDPLSDPSFSSERIQDRTNDDKHHDCELRLDTSNIWPVLPRRKGTKRAQPRTAGTHTQLGQW
jgi:hypothetical protein